VLEELRERAALVGLLDGRSQRRLVDPAHARDDLHLRADDLVALPLDLVHHDGDRDVEVSRRRSRRGQLADERHREAAAVRGR
jgi:hypothetical protein